MSLLNITARAVVFVIVFGFTVNILNELTEPERVKPIETPVVTKPVKTQHKPIQLSLDQVDLKSLECLAQNIYHEARGESEKGQVAVALVTRNRVKDPRFPNTYCGVVRQGRITSHAPATKKWECQFTWFCDGKPDTVQNMDAWRHAVKIAYDVIYANALDFTKGATHYHANYVSPYWRTDRQLTKVKIVDNHIFYRWELRA
jgi:spore germination cell wall hydrolase CwlJ-like protein